MKLTVEAIIFDMDGVLVDVQASYREAIKRTVSTMLTREYAMTAQVSDKQIEILKSIPGFNNDWDLSYAMIKLMSAQTLEKDYTGAVSPVTPQHRTSDLYKKIKDIFQGFYLGKTLYEKLYTKPIPVDAPTGLIANETLLIKRDLLERLSKRYSLAIATSRPRFEALYALTNLELMPSIFTEQTLVAQEDAPREKPFPDPLREAQKRIQKNNCVYVGDTINDIKAAAAAGMKSIYIGTGTLGDYQLPDINSLETLL